MSYYFFVHLCHEAAWVHCRGYEQETVAIKFLGGAQVVYVLASYSIYYSNLSDQCSNVLHLLELTRGTYIHGASLTMKSVSLKYIQRNS